MASRIREIYKNVGTHAVGNINQMYIQGNILQGGAKATEDMDNWTMGVLGFDADGVRTISPLTDDTQKGLLICSVEDIVSEHGEDLRDFYNGAGEMCRVLFMNGNPIHFETSNFAKSATVTTVTKGLPAYYNATDKKFIVVDATTDADYTNAKNKFIVVGVTSDDDSVAYDPAFEDSLYGLEMIKLEQVYE